ncbi:hypothetical protein H0266_13650 [Halobacillus locisalis]|uniref:Uncharacterized protein n=1 Tax=Halobacillus locisalis TaxID=220753 RepID=A0A838CV47_9BACI|nr:hypothetical protein [Halobacillus locisalis]MBA2175937.1 hypothetical protein [Halobacillus locisalis]
MRREFGHLHEDIGHRVQLFGQSSRIGHLKRLFGHLHENIRHRIQESGQDAPDIGHQNDYSGLFP